MTVHLLWLHDGVLGVYRSAASAESAAAHVMRERFPGQPFIPRRRSNGGVRWTSDDNPHPISRLEVEPVEVQP